MSLLLLVMVVDLYVLLGDVLCVCFCLLGVNNELFGGMLVLGD